MKKEVFGRIVYDIALFVSILFFPWWMTLVFVCVGVVIYENYIECIIAGFFVDLLYEAWTIPFVFMAFFLCAYVLFGKLKKHIRIYG